MKRMLCTRFSKRHTYVVIFDFFFQWIFSLEPFQMPNQDPIKPFKKPSMLLSLEVSLRLLQGFIQTI